MLLGLALASGEDYAGLLLKRFEFEQIASDEFAGLGDAAECWPTICGGSDISTF